MGCLVRSVFFFPLCGLIGISALVLDAFQPKIFGRNLGMDDDRSEQRVTESGETFPRR